MNKSEWKLEKKGRKEEIVIGKKGSENETNGMEKRMNEEKKYTNVMMKSVKKCDGKVKK